MYLPPLVMLRGLNYCGPQIMLHPLLQERNFQIVLHPSDWRGCVLHSLHLQRYLGGVFFMYMHV
jgi:hypothetical protein